MRTAIAAFCGVMAMSSVAAAAELKDAYVEANGIKFHYVSAGKPGAGPMIVLLHGFPAYWGMWKGELADLGNDHFVVAPDMRGYNLSSKPEALDQYQMKHLVEDVRAFAEKVGGKGKKFVLVAHDWGGGVAWPYAIFHPETLEKLVIINAPHPVTFERELRENPAQRAASSYMFTFNGFDKVKAEDTFSGNDYAAIKGLLRPMMAAGMSQEDADAWVKATAQPGALTGGLNYYRANHANPPFNDTHPAASIATSWSAKEVLAGAKSDVVSVPTLVIWGAADTALPTGNLSGLEKYVTTVKFRLYNGGDHWIPITKPKEISADIREFVSGKKAAAN